MINVDYNRDLNMIIKISAVMPEFENCISVFRVCP